MSWPSRVGYPCPSPSFLAMHPTLPVLYAVSEQEGGALVAFHLGEAEEARAIKTGGSSPCHVAVHPGGAIAAVANYADGSVALVGLDTGGLPADEPLVHRFSGSGPNKE